MRRTRRHSAQSKKKQTSPARTQSSAPPSRASAAKGGLNVRVSLKSLKSLIEVGVSRTAYSPLSIAHTKSRQLPNDFLRQASAV